MDKTKAIDIIKTEIGEMGSEAVLYNEGDFELLNALKMAVEALEKEFNLGDGLENEVTYFAERNDYKLTDKQVSHIVEDLCNSESFTEQIDMGIEKAIVKSVSLNKKIRDFAKTKRIALADDKVEDIVCNLCCECNELYELNVTDIERGIREWV